MRTIICKKCGATIDAALGECPNCGAVYYILPEENAAGQSPAADSNVQRSTPLQSFSIADANKEDIFNTGVWKSAPFSDPDETRAFAPPPQQPRRAYYPPTRPQESELFEREESATQEILSRHRARRVAVEQKAPPPKRKGMTASQKSMVVAAVALFAVLVLVIAFMSDAFDFNKNKEKLTMPDVTYDYMIDKARPLLENMGLKVEAKAEYSAYPESTVIAQSIKAGKVVRAGDEVMLTVSLGPNEDTSLPPAESITVPDFTRSTYDQAKYELDTLGLRAVRAEDQYSEQAEGTVISQNPVRGTIVQKGDSVVLYVSKGPEPSPSPASYKITVTAGSGGTVTPKGLVAVEENGEVTFTIAPSSGYEIREVKVDGTDVGPVGSYTFTNVTGDHTLYVVFKVKTETPTPTPPASQTPTPPESVVPDPQQPVQ